MSTYINWLRHEIKSKTQDREWLQSGTVPLNIPSPKYRDDPSSNYSSNSSSIDSDDGDDDESSSSVYTSENNNDEDSEVTATPVQMIQPKFLVTRISEYQAELRETIAGYDVPKVDEYKAKFEEFQQQNKDLNLKLD